MSPELKEWLEHCPQPVVARVIESELDLRHLMITHSVYEENVLVVIDLKSIANCKEE
jgi:hypothetical protein